MATLEQKIDLVMQYIIEDNKKDKKLLKEAIIAALSEETECSCTIADYTLEDVIEDFLKEIGTPTNIKGYDYVAYAIVLSIRDEDYINSITKRLYPDIAERFGTVPSRVERAIRHAVERTWIRIDMDTAKRLFGNAIDPDKGKLVNSEFLAVCRKIVIRRMRALR